MQRPTITPFDLDILRLLEAACREFQVGRSAEFVRPAEGESDQGREPSTNALVQARADCSAAAQDRSAL